MNGIDAHGVAFSKPTEWKSSNCVVMGRDNDRLQRYLEQMLPGLKFVQSIIATTYTMVKSGDLMMNSRMIKVYDANDKVLVAEEAKSKASRMSMQAAADQRQIEGLYRRGAVRAELLFPDGSVMMNFEFDKKGYPQAKW